MAQNSPADDLCAEAKTHLKNKDLKQAIACYEKAISLDKRHVDAHEGLAKVSFMMKEYPRAIELFKRASLLNPRRVEPLVNMGAVMNRQEKYADAVRTLRSALMKDRKCAEAYYNLGIAYRGQKQDNMAVNSYKEAIRLNPEMVDAYYNLGRVLMDMGNATQAILNLEKAVQLNPNFEKARHALEKAEELKLEAKKAISPFGRLVKVDELAGKTAGSAYRDLSSQERFEDRDLVHKLAKEAELQAAEAAEHIRAELEPALLGVSRQMTNAEPDPYSFNREVELFGEARAKFNKLRILLKVKVAEIREHEEKIRK